MKAQKQRQGGSQWLRLILFASLLFLAVLSARHVRASASTGCVAISDGASITGSLDAPGAEDCYTFAVNDQDRVTLFADNLTNGGSEQLRLRVRNPDGVEVATATSVFGSYDVETADLIMTATGNYTVLVDGPNDTTGTYTLGYANLRIDNTLIVEGEAHAAQIEYAGDEDAWSFTGQAGDRVTAFADNLTATGTRQLELSIISPAGIELARTSSTFGGYDVETADVILPGDGTYSIVVDGIGDALGSYTLGFVNLRIDSTLIAEGQGYAGAVDYVGDEDGWTFSGVAGDRVTAFVDNLTSTGTRQIELSIISPIGIELARSSSAFGGYDVETADLLLPGDGTYTVIVDGIGDAVGQYLLGFTNLSLDTSPVTDGQAYAATVGFAGDEDGWSFDGSAGDRVTAFVDNLTTTGTRQLELSIISPAGIELMRSGSTFGGYDVENADLLLPGDGTYTIIVDGIGDASGQYVLGFSNLSDDTTPVEDGNGYAALIDHGGDEDAWSFVGQAGDRVTAFANNLTTTGTRQLELSILTPSGIELARSSSTFGGYDVENADLILPGDGMYTIIVDGIGDASGQYVLGFSNIAEDTEVVGGDFGRTTAIDHVGDEDAWGVHVTAGTVITALVDNQTTTGTRQLELTILDANGLELARHASTFGGYDLAINALTISADGMITIIVDGLGDAAGLYHVDVTCNGTCSIPTAIKLNDVASHQSDLTFPALLIFSTLISLALCTRRLGQFSKQHKNDPVKFKLAVRT